MLSGDDDKKAAEDGNSSSSDEDIAGRDEAQYRITVPLDIKLAPPVPLFATAPHLVLPPALPLLPVSHPPLPSVAPNSMVHTAQLAVHQRVHPVPLMTVTTRPVPPVNIIEHRPQLGQQQQQQLMLPVAAHQLLVRQPRCRDYDGQCVLCVRKFHVNSLHVS